MTDESLEESFDWFYYLGEVFAILITVIGFFVLGVVVMLAMLFFL
jgi:hypothetical protein